MTAALKDRMDLALQIAIGSATQIVMFVAPVLVIVSLFFFHPMNLVFELFSLVSIIFCVFVTNAMVEDGVSTWFEGFQLLIAYVIIATAFFFSSMKARSIYVRNIIFGIEDSLVSTVGLLAGIAVGNASIHTILSTGVIYVFVEGFSMAVGSFLSEESAQEYETGMSGREPERILGGGHVRIIHHRGIRTYLPVPPAAGHGCAPGVSGPFSRHARRARVRACTLR